MLHQDQGCPRASGVNHQVLKESINWLLSGICLSAIQFRDDCRWTARGLIAVALLWAWSDESTLVGRFIAAVKIFQRGPGRRRKLPSSYQAFTKILRKWTGKLRLAVMAALQERMQQDLSERFTLFGFAVFGVDGSRLELPRTASNETRYSPRGKKMSRKGKRRRRGRSRGRAGRDNKKVNCPQMWLTTMWHAGTGLPWDWRTGPSGSSEREHMLQMIDRLPPEALLTADAGFVGYDYWKTLLDSDREFVIRVGSNVRLLKKLGRARHGNGLVYLWPANAAKRNLPPLVLRLVVLKTGRHPVYVVTSVLDPKRLSDKQVAEIYRRRWGIEVYYRHFKQGFGRRKLRSKSADNAQIEADWSLLGLWAMCLYAQCQLAEQEVQAERISVCGVIHAYRSVMRDYKSRPDPGEDLYSLLDLAVIDEYRRTSKASRDYPRKKQEKPPGAPKIYQATREQIEKAREICSQTEIRLTA